MAERKESDQEQAKGGKDLLWEISGHPNIFFKTRKKRLTSYLVFKRTRAHMPIARKFLVNNEESGVYHCISRCVRRAFLCGFDALSGRSYEHRKAWVQMRIFQLCSVSSIEVLAYAVMSNHTHLVVKTNPERSKCWSDEEVARRWLRLKLAEKDETFRLHEPGAKDIENLLKNPKAINEYRRRLGNLSWFMGQLNEKIACRANREDNCTGSFWEARFKSQRLANPAAVLACMVYVDLNPIRSKIAESPETSEFTSIYDRIVAYKAEEAAKENACLVQSSSMPESCASANSGTKISSKTSAALKRKSDEEANAALKEKFDVSSSPFADPCARAACLYDLSEDSQNKQKLLGISLEYYLNLVDWTGRCLRAEKAAIPSDLAPIFERLKLNTEQWVDNTKTFHVLYKHVAGTAKDIKRIARQMGRKWFLKPRTELSLFKEEKSASLASA